MPIKLWELGRLAWAWPLPRSNQSRTRRLSQAQQLFSFTRSASGKKHFPAFTKSPPKSPRAAARNFEIEIAAAASRSSRAQPRRPQAPHPAPLPLPPSVGIHQGPARGRLLAGVKRCGSLLLFFGGDSLIRNLSSFHCLGGLRCPEKWWFRVPNGTQPLSSPWSWVSDSI